MLRAFFIALAGLLVVSSAPAAVTSTRGDLRDLYFGEALYHAYLGEHFDAIARLDAELGQHYGLDEPELDSLQYHIGEAEFSVGDFELYYRMHQRAGRAIKVVLDGKVEDSVRNEAAFRLARLYFQKEQPVNAQQALERIRGKVPDAIRDDVAFLRAQVLMANGRFSDAVNLLRDLQNAKSLEGFAAYNLGIALWRDGHLEEGGRQLDRAGQISSNEPATLAMKDKSNLVLGSALLENKHADLARQYLERVRLSGPYSNRALLAAGWADVSDGRYERAVVPWTLLVQRDVTDRSVQEGLLALPFAYGKLNVYGKAALLYGKALESFGGELGKLTASIKSIHDGKFLDALRREELKQDGDWLVKLRNLPESPETYYLMDLMASHDFQTSLRNYLDLEELREKLVTWDDAIDAYAELVDVRRGYYQPLLPDIDKTFRALDSQMRVRLEQRERIAARISAMLVSPRPDFLATADERIAREKLAEIERAAKKSKGKTREEMLERVGRLRGVLQFRIQTEYDRRLTEAYQHQRQLDAVVQALKRQYDAFVRTRQAARQSYEGYQAIAQLRGRVRDAREKVATLIARQGHMLEAMAINELESRAKRLEEYQVKARFAMADSYDRAVKAQSAGRTQ
jgi:tetratricopeptide (TPR) repeat protein